MIKMVDVLEQNLVQNFTHSLQSQIEFFDNQLNLGILNASELQLTNVINNFFAENDALEIAYALDISPERIQAIQTGAVLKQENLSDTAKLVALCLALETNTLNAVSISDCLKDYPM